MAQGDRAVRKDAGGIERAGLRSGRAPRNTDGNTTCNRGQGGTAEASGWQGRICRGASYWRGASQAALARSGSEGISWFRACGEASMSNLSKIISPRSRNDCHGLGRAILASSVADGDEVGLELLLIILPAK